MRRRNLLLRSLRDLLAWRNLAHDRIRFAVTLVGVVFSVALMGMQGGLLIGFIKTISLVIEKTDADIWIAGRGVRSVDLPANIPERRLYQALSTPGVATASPFIHAFAMMKRPDGGAESVIVVGFDTATGRGAPWSVVDGSVDDLAIPNGVIVDRMYKEKLGVDHIGQTVEIIGKQARVVGFTEGVRTFTQSPHVFTDIKNARHFVGYDEDRLNYVLIKLAEGADPAAVVARLRAKMPEVDVYTKDEFYTRSYMYWMVTTGAGISLVIAAALGLIVGIVVTAQTLYATTMDRLPEYATLRAIGAPAGYLYGVILRQAVIAAGFGYGAGMLITMQMVIGAKDSSAAILMPWQFALFLAAATFLMCASAAILSIRRVMAIDPVSVFK